MRISDWSSDVCSSDLGEGRDADEGDQRRVAPVPVDLDRDEAARRLEPEGRPAGHHRDPAAVDCPAPERDRCMAAHGAVALLVREQHGEIRSEEHTSELQSLMRISYAVFCLKKKINKTYEYHGNTVEDNNPI